MELPDLPPLQTRTVAVDGIPPTPAWMSAAVDWQNKTAESTNAETENENTASSSTGSTGSGKLTALLKLIELFKD